MGGWVGAGMGWRVGYGGGGGVGLNNVRSETNRVDGRAMVVCDLATNRDGVFRVNDVYRVIQRKRYCAPWSDRHMRADERCIARSSEHSRVLWMGPDDTRVV